ncbi:hypothetical protein UFOVP597_22 [uncultured Caudovirales phage]|uniref:Uncharacterized protein n=1 Tax=uncultured Caudovirales phage TaxID=2100421 RepID=A0A6J5N2L8_9CAUD|nr:hypothetical protein UFOVP597_22 [uncultured Caudovirales phage]
MKRIKSFLIWIWNEHKIINKKLKEIKKNQSWGKF